MLAKSPQGWVYGVFLEDLRYMDRIDGTAI
jgi:hypothetical protein